MFPFDLPGPQFLGFYALFAIAVIAAFYFGRRQYESGPIPSIDLTDPFLFACLRGGPKEVVRIATLGLIDRGLLKATGAAGSTLARAPEAKPELVRRRIEKEVLSYFEHPEDINSILQRPAIERVAADDYEDRLRRDRLVPDAETLKTRFLFLVATLAALIGVGGTKLIVALSAGRSNVMFLIVMMAIATFVAVKIRSPYRTATGDACLAGARSMFSALQGRGASIKPGSGSRELLWLTALFGAAALPTSAYPHVPQLWPKPQASGSGSGCGSSCGSGSGCGGGGGGCGGCGS
jgi:uncharacterized protein (TIGR04222 family)